jgi:hypothetical protein
MAELLWNEDGAVDDFYSTSLIADQITAARDDAAS